MKKICIYCSSSSQIDDVYFEATERLAELIVKEDITVVYGGGSSGLMGKLADAILDLDGNIKGIMPQFMNEVEWAHKRVTDMEFTDTMHERKRRFLVGIDGVVALPGGSGTLEELMEAITLKRLGLFTKPITILNTNHYYDPLKAMLTKCVDEQFMNKKHLDMWTFVEKPGEVIDSLKNAAEWSKDAITFAANRQRSE